MDAVHDITVAYPKNIPQTERHLVSGHFPREIHFHVRRYPVSALPTSSSDLESWCRERWAEKEVRLRDFYSGQPRAFDRDGVARVPPCKSELRVTLIKAASLLYWSSFIALCFTGLWLWAPFRLYFLIMVGVYIAQHKRFGGLEMLEMACHRYWKSMSADVSENNKLLDGKMKWGNTVAIEQWRVTTCTQQSLRTHLSTLVQSSELKDPMVEPSAPCLRKTKISAPTMVCMASVERASFLGGGRNVNHIKLCWV